MLRMVDILTALFGVVVVFMFFDTYMEKRDNARGCVYVLGITGLATGLYMSNAFFHSTLPNLICFVILMFAFAWLFDSGIKVKFILSILNVGITSITEIIVLYILAYTEHMTPDQVVKNVNLVVLGTILSKILYFAIIKIICIKKSKLSLKLRSAYWGLFTSSFSVALITIYLIFSLQQKNEISNLSIVCSVGLLYSVLITLYLYERMSEQAEQLKTAELMERQLESQVKHIKELALMQDKLRGIRHDLSNHMIALKSLINIEDYKNANEYINKLITDADLHSETVDTGNTVIDALINAKRSMAKKDNIDFYVRLQIPENIPIDASDSCIILGNTLDNAIEACNKLSEGKYIKLYLDYHDKSLSCKIQNSTVPNTNNALISSKKDTFNHGIGINNIKRALNNYKNIYRMEQVDDEFVFSFIIFDVPLKNLK